MKILSLETLNFKMGIHFEQCIFQYIGTTQFELQVRSVICLSSSAMDIKELKFLDIQSTVNKPSPGTGAATEPSFIPSGRHGQSNRVSHPHVTSSSSHSNAAPITILRRGR